MCTQELERPLRFRIAPTDYSTHASQARHQAGDPQIQRLHTRLDQRRCRSLSELERRDARIGSRTGVERMQHRREWLLHRRA